MFFEQLALDLGLMLDLQLVEDVVDLLPDDGRRFLPSSMLAAGQMREVGRLPLLEVLVAQPAVRHGRHRDHDLHGDKLVRREE